MSEEIDGAPGSVLPNGTHHAARHGNRRAELVLLIQKQVWKLVRQWRDLLDHLAVRGHLGEYGVECNLVHLRPAAAEAGLAEGGREGTGNCCHE